jgi:hypothetical protein
VRVRSAILDFALFLPFADTQTRFRAANGRIGSPAATQAGVIQRATTLFGEIGLPDRVANTSRSPPTSRTCRRQSAKTWSAASFNGMSRRPAAVFGEPNTPSYTASVTCSTHTLTSGTFDITAFDLTFN